VGGAFTTAGGVVANHIAKWDGTTWSALGAGIDGAVFAMALDGAGNLYAGGDFTSAGGVAANHIAKWDGRRWGALGAGTGGVVLALAVDSADSLYVGGDFTSAGGEAANYIAKWDGKRWAALGSGLDAWLYALALDSADSLYVGGYFTSAGGEAANHIARWDGSAWSALGSGTDHSVDALAIDSAHNLYAGGGFTRAGDKASNYIAQYRIPIDHIGVWRPSTGRFMLDTNGNGKWDGNAGGDTLTDVFGQSADIPVIGDWNGDGTDEVGVWRPSADRFMLDTNGNGKWDGNAGGDTLTDVFGQSTDIPVIGDWNGDGTDEVGVWRPSTDRFMLDTNGNGKWDGNAGGDTLTGVFGQSTDIPVIGDWNGDGKDEVGVWRPSMRKFLLDTNGNGKWDGNAGGDTLTGVFGQSTDIPVIGDWNGDGTDEVGVWRPSTDRFMLDTNGNGKWDGTAGGDTLTAAFGESTDRPVTGRW
jgi:hypothetical protein